MTPRLQNVQVPNGLVVHPDLGVLSNFQEAFRRGGATLHIARDLPTAVLVCAENEFDFVLVASQLQEKGDGFALGALLRRVFPYAFVAVIAEASVLSLKEAINRGFDQLYDPAASAQDIATQLLAHCAEDPQQLPN